MRVPEKPVCIDLFRQNPVFTSLHLKYPVHVVPPLLIQSTRLTADSVAVGHDEMVGLHRLSQISRLYSGPKRWPLGVLAPNSIDLADYAYTKVSSIIIMKKLYSVSLGLCQLYSEPKRLPLSPQLIISKLS